VTEGAELRANTRLQRTALRAAAEPPNRSTDEEAGRRAITLKIRG
jgi:hypothetical protein